MTTISIDPNSLCSSSLQNMDSKLNVFKRFGSKRSSTLQRSSATTSKDSNMAAPLPRRTSNANPFSRTEPTRRPPAPGPPPAYSPTDSNPAPDSPFAFLAQFDTVFLIDDSGSMAGRSWTETKDALSKIAPICTEFDANGIDIFFLNHRNPAASDNLRGYTNITSAAAVDQIFSAVRPLGGTPTGTRLNAILKPYCNDLENSVERQAHGQEATVKPLNIIVVTDGVPSDDVESVIVNHAKKLDKCAAEPWQVGIQFFQVGREPEAAADLQELDDALSGTHGVRDIVDTVPWTGDDGQVLTADGILKVCLGSVVKRLDRRGGNDQRLRK